MKIDAALQGADRLYIDAAPLIYFVEEHRHYIRKMNRIFELIEKKSLQTVSSALVMTELLVQPLKLGNTDLAQDYYDILFTGSQRRLVSVTTDIAISGAAIRARYNLRTPDAIHVATALREDCDTILTNDRHFRRVQDLNILVLDDLEL